MITMNRPTARDALYFTLFVADLVALAVIGNIIFLVLAALVALAWIDRR